MITNERFINNSSIFRLMKRHNLHSHTTYSDGELSPETLLAKAKQEGLDILGISDHAFAGKLPDDWQVTERLEQYLSHLQNIKNFFNGIELKIGAEIETDIYSTHPSQLPFDLLNKFDYVLFEYVGEKKNNGRDISQLIQIRKKLTIPAGLAHNDLQKNYDGEEAYIAKILSENDIFVEICQSEGLRNSRSETNGCQDYYKLFKPQLIEALVKNKVKVVIGTDTHSGDAVSQINDAYNFIIKNNLKYHELAI